MTLTNNGIHNARFHFCANSAATGRAMRSGCSPIGDTDITLTLTYRGGDKAVFVLVPLCAKRLTCI